MNGTPEEPTDEYLHNTEGNFGDVGVFDEDDPNLEPDLRHEISTEEQKILRNSQ